MSASELNILDLYEGLKEKVISFLSKAFQRTGKKRATLRKGFLCLFIIYP